MGYKFIDEESSIKKKSVEVMQNNETELMIQDNSDISQTIKELNSDLKEKDTKFSSIDLKTRLEPVEIGAILSADALVSLGFFPEAVSNITRSKKRLAVSQKGKGREEIVQIAQGMKDAQNGRSFGERFMGMFGGSK